MLTRIVHNSAKLCPFIDQLNLNLSRPQSQHILNLADALLVCEDEKTLAALQRQFLEARDASNWADVLWISPWKAEQVRSALRINQVQWAIARKMLVVVWHLLTKNVLVHQADPDRLARKFLEFAYSMEKDQRGKSAQEFVRERLDLLGIGAEMEFIRQSSLPRKIEVSGVPNTK
ncbi:MAG TPA: hypothetical protein VJ785_04595 [Anaerolineales bacterium]|nr:hypothetical protein [Anaerolineales bacterium]